MRLLTIRRAAISSKASRPYSSSNGVISLLRREEQPRRFVHKNLRSFRGSELHSGIVKFPSPSSTLNKLLHHRQQQQVTRQSILSSKFIVDPFIRIQSRGIWSILNTFSSSGTKKEDELNQEEIQRGHKVDEAEKEDLVDDDIPSHLDFSYRNIKDCELLNIVQIPPGDLLNDKNNTIALSDIKKVCEKLVTDQDFFEAFRLIDRLFLEINFYNISNNHDDNSMNSQYDKFRTMATALLQYTVEQWSIVYETTVQQSGSDPKVINQLFAEGKIPTPYDIWSRIAKLRTAPSSQVVHRIMELTKYRQTKSSGRMSKFGPKLADKVISLMIERPEMPNPTIDSFNTALSSWEVYARKMYFEKQTISFDYAIQRLLDLLELARQCDDVTPNRDTYQIIMRALSYRGDGDKVEELLEEMYVSYLNCLENENDDASKYMPSTECFSLVLFAWKQSNDTTGIAAERASDILDKLIELESSQEIPSLKVTPSCFDIVLKCWSEVDNNNKERPGKMQSLYDRMVELSKLDPSKLPTAQTRAIMEINQSRSEASEIFPTGSHRAEPKISPENVPADTDVEDHVDKSFSKEIDLSNPTIRRAASWLLFRKQVLDGSAPEMWRLLWDGIIAFEEEAISHDTGFQSQLEPHKHEGIPISLFQNELYASDMRKQQGEASKSLNTLFLQMELWYVALRIFLHDKDEGLALHWLRTADGDALVEQEEYCNRLKVAISTLAKHAEDDYLKGNPRLMRLRQNLLEKANLYQGDFKCVVFVYGFLDGHNISQFINNDTELQSLGLTSRMLMKQSRKRLHASRWLTSELPKRRFAKQFQSGELSVLVLYGGFEVEDYAGFGLDSVNCIINYNQPLASEYIGKLGPELENLFIDNGKEYSQDLTIHDVEEVQEELRRFAAANIRAARSLLFSEFAIARPLDSLWRYSQKMNGTIEYKISAREQYLTRLTCIIGTTKYNAEGVGMTKHESRKAAALKMMDQLKGRPENGGTASPNLGPWHDEEVSIAPSNAKSNGALLNDADVRALPLQTLHNYMQNMRVAFDVEVTTTIISETKAVYNQGEIIVVANGMGESEYASKKAAGVELLSKLRADFETKYHETGDELVVQ